MKLKRLTCKFIIYKIEGPEIVTEAQSDSGAWEDFVSMLPADDCRYAIYDCNFETTDGRPGNKLVMVSWYFMTLR